MGLAATGFNNHARVMVYNKGGRATMSISRRLGAEFIGTFWLVLGGCGTAVLAAGFPHLGVGFVGVALAFG